MISKEDAAKQLPKLWERIVEECKQWDREDALIGLLCLEDAYSNLLNAVSSRGTEGTEQTETETALLFNMLSKRFEMIEMALSLILIVGRSGHRRLDSFPEIEFSIASNPGTALSAQKIGPEDSFVYGPMRLAGKVEAGWAVKVKGAKGTIREAVSLGLLDLLDMISLYLSYRGAVRLNTSLTLLDDQSIARINYPATLTPEKMLNMEVAGPRVVFRSALAVPMWSSEYDNLSQEAVSARDFGLDSYANRATLKKEEEEIFKAYDQFPGFKELFESDFRFSLPDFRQVTSFLMRIARPRSHCVYTGLRNKIVNDSSKTTRLPKSVVNRVLTSLEWRPGLPPLYFPVLPFGIQRVFSWWRIVSATLLILEGYFESAYDNNMKGQVFERVCRTELSNHGFSVHPTRFVVAEQVLSTEDSMGLWGHVKMGTDFDVLGAKQKYLIVLECKEKKPSTSRRVRVGHMFAKYHQELLLKTLWLRDNLNRLSGSPCMKNISSEGKSYLLPLMVSTFVVDDLNPLVSLLTSKELYYVLQHLDTSISPKSDEFLEIPLLGGKWQEVRCFPFTSA